MHATARNHYAHACEPFFQFSAGVATRKFKFGRFASCLAGPGVQYVTIPSPVGLSWVLSLLHSIKQVLSDFGRVIQLLWLLAPLACWAPLAFGHGYGRQQWTHHFR